MMLLNKHFAKTYNITVNSGKNVHIFYLICIEFNNLNII